METTKSPITISEETQIDRPASRKYFPIDHKDWYRLKKMINRISDGQNWWSNCAWFMLAATLSFFITWMTTVELDNNKKVFFVATVFSFIITVILFVFEFKLPQSNKVSKKEILEEMDAIEQNQQVIADNKKIIWSQKKPLML